MHALRSEKQPPGETLALFEDVVACMVAADAPHPRQLAKEVLLFLSTKVAHGDTKSEYVVSPPLQIDYGWHAMIMETRLYGSVCEKLGGGFIDHSAKQMDVTPDGRLERVKRYIRFRGFDWDAKFDEPWSPKRPPLALAGEMAVEQVFRPSRYVLPGDFGVNVVMYGSPPVGAPVRLTVDVRFTTLVEELKHEIERRDPKWSPARMVLTFRDRELRDGDTLVEHGVGPNSELILREAARGHERDDDHP